MSETTHAADLSKRVYSIVLQYVLHRTEDRTGLTWKQAQAQAVVDPQTGKKVLPREYRDAREKVCQSAFLAMRSCRSRQDFVEFFTGTVFYVPQFLPPAEYQLLAQALFGPDAEWEQVKALSILTLSALSQV
jgi:CRISPR-associated protein Cmx8